MNRGILLLSAAHEVAILAFFGHGRSPGSRTPQTVQASSRGAANPAVPGDKAGTGSDTSSLPGSAKLEGSAPMAVSSPRQHSGGAVHERVADERPIEAPDVPTEPHVGRPSEGPPATSPPKLDPIAFRPLLSQIAAPKADSQFAKERYRGLAVSGDGKWAITGDIEGGVQLWDVAQRSQVTHWKPHKTTVNWTSFSSDGRRALSGTYRGEVGIFNIEKRSQERVIATRFDVRCAFFLPGDQQIVAAGREAGIAYLAIFDVATGRPVRGFTRPGGNFCLAASRDGINAVTGDWDGSVVAWDLVKGQPRAIGRHEGVVRSVLYLHDDLVLSAGADGLVHEWDLRRGAKIATIRGHTREVMSLAVSPDGKLLATGSADGLRLWDLATRTLLRHFDTTPSGSWYVAFVPGRTGIVSVGREPTPLFWPIHDVPGSQETP